MRVLIVGLGLIGGSIAKTLKKNTEWSILGIDCDTDTQKSALEAKAVDGIWDGESALDCDIAVFCTKPTLTVGLLESYAKYFKPKSVVTDVCGIKQWVVAECEKLCDAHGLHFVGGHPMAGKERSGFKNSDENLFNRASYILTPTENTDKTALETAKQYVEALKCAKLTVTDPKTHDRLIAFTSQLPHIIAGAYVKSPSCLDRKGFSAGSFKDVSRVATVDENLWSELFLKNGEMLLKELDGLISHLTDYRNAIAQNNEQELKEILKQGRIIKENDLKVE